MKQVLTKKKHKLIISILKSIYIYISFCYNKIKLQLFFLTSSQRVNNLHFISYNIITIIIIDRSELLGAVANKEKETKKEV